MVINRPSLAGERNGSVFHGMTSPFSESQMNVFVLCTGRCGSTTFARACGHISNYSVAHESRAHLIGDDRLRYPLRHIEIDNRLSWYLGRLEAEYGDEAFYVHLKRDVSKTARSFLKRYSYGIIRAYARAVVLGGRHIPLDVCIDYCHTVNSNIASYLRTKSNTMTFQLENAKVDFLTFWERIRAEGDFSAAVSEWNSRYYAS